MTSHICTNILHSMKVLRKQSLHGGNSSLSLIEAVHLRKWKNATPMTRLSNLSRALLLNQNNKQCMIPVDEKNETIQWPCGAKVQLTSVYDSELSRPEHVVWEYLVQLTDVCRLIWHPRGIPLAVCNTQSSYFLKVYLTPIKKSKVYSIGSFKYIVNVALIVQWFFSGKYGAKIQPHSLIKEYILFSIQICNIPKTKIWFIQMAKMISFHSWTV